MRVAIIGYGKMGKMVKKEAEKLSIGISKIIVNQDELKKAIFCSDEVAIEYTEANQSVHNIITLSRKGVKVVCGTTGWYKKLNRVVNCVKENGNALLYGSNFSIGVNIFFELVKLSAMIMNKFHEYDLFVKESHHRSKKDNPSGTSLTVAEILLKEINRKSKVVSKTIQRGLYLNELHISSARGGNTIGEHQIVYDSSIDSISILHSTKNRSAYANISIACCKWISERVGVFTFYDFFKEEFL